MLSPSVPLYSRMSSLRHIGTQSVALRSNTFLFFNFRWDHIDLFIFMGHLSLWKSLVRKNESDHERPSQERKLICYCFLGPRRTHFCSHEKSKDFPKENVRFSVNPGIFHSLREESWAFLEWEQRKNSPSLWPWPGALGNPKAVTLERVRLGASRSQSTPDEAQVPCQHQEPQPRRGTGRMPLHWWTDF